ncbi:MAG: hypothetical protein JKY73_06750, partial [Lutibacter sp.]|nr:hypothetical protein [Lutibacter sp.]
MKKNYIVLFFALFSAIYSFGQAVGDFQSNSSGEWTTLTSWQTWDGSSWGLVSEYPGQSTGTYTVTILAGHTISISTNLTTLAMGELLVDGSLILGDGTSTQHSTTLTTDLITIGNSGVITFDGIKVRLTLPNPNSAILILNGGTINGKCTNNDEIFIGSTKYATCVGGGSTTYSFGNLIAAGGTFNAVITIPPSDPYIIEACTSVNLTGTYTGSTTGTVTYEWKLKYEGDLNFTSLGVGENLPFSPTIVGNHFLSFEVTDDFYTNVETRVFNITADVTVPTITGTLTPIATEGCDIGDKVSATNTLVYLRANGLTINDACNDTGLTVTSSDSAPSGTCPIILTRTYTVTDTCGNATTTTQAISIDDTNDPTVTGTLTPIATEGCNISDLQAPTNTLVYLRANGLTINDACGDGGLTVTSSDSAPSGTCPIILTRTYTVTDTCGNAT